MSAVVEREALESHDVIDTLDSIANQLDYFFMAHHSYIVELTTSSGIGVENELRGFFDMNAHLIQELRAFSVALEPHIA